MHLQFLIGSMSGSIEMNGEDFVAGKSTLIEFNDW
jgi:hypothetical protein